MSGDALGDRGREQLAIDAECGAGRNARDIRALEELRAGEQETTLECISNAVGRGLLSNAVWTGVPLSELARLAGVDDASELSVGSLQPAGVLRQATLARNQVADSRSLLALSVAGEELSRDHGYPARIIVPGLPGVHNTKWVGSMEFRA